MKALPILVSALMVTLASATSLASATRCESVFLQTFIPSSSSKIAIESDSNSKLEALTKQFREIVRENSKEKDFVISTQESLDKMAAEVRSLREEVLISGNTKLMDDYNYLIFKGLFHRELMERNFWKDDKYENRPLFKIDEALQLIIVQNNASSFQSAGNTAAIAANYKTSFMNNYVARIQNHMQFEIFVRAMSKDVSNINFFEIFLKIKTQEQFDAVKLGVENSYNLNYHNTAIQVTTPYQVRAFQLGMENNFNNMNYFNLIAFRVSDPVALSKLKTIMDRGANNLLFIANQMGFNWNN